jgi:hypothetical protein
MPHWLADGFAGDCVPEARGVVQNDGFEERAVWTGFPFGLKLEFAG